MLLAWRIPNTAAPIVDGGVSLDLTASSLLKM
jgi:hypothetical protein